jgi:hypothetical protein
MVAAGVLRPIAMRNNWRPQPRPPSAPKRNEAAAKPAPAPVQQPRVPIEESIPGMADKDLAMLRSNAVRLAASGTPAQREAAERLMPLIEAELEARRARAPTPRGKTPVRRSRAKTATAAS